MLKMNPRLERLAWQGQSTNKDIPLEIWKTLCGHASFSELSSSSSSSTYSLSPFQRLRELEFKHCNLDAVQLFPVLEKLLSLRTLIFKGVVLRNLSSVQPNLPLLQTRTSANSNNSNGSGGGSSVNSPPQQVTTTTSALAAIPTYRFPQVREIRLGPGLQESQGLESIVRFCPHLMRLVLESDFDAWSGGGTIFSPGTRLLSSPAPTALAQKQEVLPVLIQNMTDCCPRLRAFEYLAPNTRPEGVSLLSEDHYCSFAQCLELGAAKAMPEQLTLKSYHLDYSTRVTSQRPFQHVHPENRSHLPFESQKEHDRSQLGQGLDREADEQDKKDLALIEAGTNGARVKFNDLPSYVKVEFKADLYLLDHPTAWALCQASMTLQSVSLHLFHGTVDGETASVCGSLRNALQILTICQGLRSFQLEFDDINSMASPIALATFTSHHDFTNPLNRVPAAWILFETPWNCIGLESLVLSGIKRPVYLNLENTLSDLVYRRKQQRSEDQYFVAVKMRELLAISQMKDAELGIPEDFDDASDNESSESSPSTLRGGPTQGLRQFQQMMFAQLARLSELKELTLNGSSFRELSKIQQIVRDTTSL